MSKVELLVVRNKMPSAGARNDHQTDFPPALPAWRGSPNSLVARALLTLLVPDAPVNSIGLAKRSLVGSMSR